MNRPPAERCLPVKWSYRSHLRGQTVGCHKAIKINEMESNLRLRKVKSVLWIKGDGRRGAKEKRERKVCGPFRGEKKTSKPFFTTQYNINSSAVKHCGPGFLSGVTTVIFMSCGLFRQYISLVVFVGSQRANRENLSEEARDISKVSANLVFPHSCVMTRKASHPRHLSEGCRCATADGQMLH